MRTLVVVGHEPTLSELTLQLAGGRLGPPALDQVQRKFATSAVAVLRLSDGWASLRPGTAVLERFAVPRA